MGMISSLRYLIHSERYDRVSKPVLSREVTETVMPPVSKKSMVVAEYSVHGQSVEPGEGEDGTADEW